MPEPYDYTSAFAGLQSPADAFTSGLTDGITLNALQQKRQQEQVALAQRKQMQVELNALSKNPTPQAIGALMVKYPSLSEEMKRASEVLAPAQRQAQIEHGAQAYAAVLSGKTDIAQQLMAERAAALRNSGNEQEAAAYDMMGTLIKDHPEVAKTTMGLRLSAAMGDKFAETFAKLGDEQRAQELQPDAVRKGKADADTAVSGAASAKSKAVTDAVTAKYADSQALADLTKKQWDVKKIVADIDFQRESNRIATMNAAANREGNTLKREELKLKIEDARMARDDKLREKVAKAESGASAMDNMLNTVQRVLQNPALNDVVGSIEGRMPSVLSDDGADAIALLETLGSQAFLSQVPTVQGMGSLSNAEGEKLQSALQNLGRKQSESQVRANLAEVQRLVQKGRNNISKRYGVPLSAPDTPAASTPQAALPPGWTVTER